MTATLTTTPAPIGDPPPAIAGDWRGGCGDCVDGWILQTTPDEMFYIECPCLDTTEPPEWLSSETTTKRPW